MAKPNLQRNIKPKMTFKNMFQSTPIFIISVVILILLGRGAIATVLKEIETARLVSDYQKKLQELKNKQVNLNKKIDFLQTSEGQESELRSIYNSAKPGESVVLIIDPKTNTTTPVTQKTWWQKFKEFFGN